MLLAKATNVLMYFLPDKTQKHKDNGIRHVQGPQKWTRKKEVSDRHV